MRTMATLSRQPAPAEGTVIHREIDYFLQILGLSSFAIAQPILDVMGRSPETFVFRGAETTQIVLFGVLVTLVPSLVLSMVAAASRIFGARVRWGVHVASLGIVGSVIVIQIGKMATPLRGAVLLAIAVFAGAMAVWLVVRVRAVNTWLRWSAVAPAAFLLVFLLMSPASKLLGSAEAGEAAAGADPIPVVMVLFDELPLASLIDPAGEINGEMFPNFKDLASSSTWYRNYTVSESFTTYSVPTILTGKTITDRSSSPLATDHPDNLFTLLSETHRLEVFETATRLCPPDVCSGGSSRASEGRGVPGLLSDAWLVWTDLTLPNESLRDTTVQFAEPSGEEETTDEGSSPGGPALARFLETFTSGERAGLHYFHVMLPHVPWRAFPSGEVYQVLNWRNDLPVVSTETTRPWVDEPWPVQLARQRHLLQLQYTDGLLGRILEELRSAQMYDDALVIVTSDHGLGLHPGRERKAATPANMHEIYWVPLLMKAPHQQRARVDERNLMATDLLPTIADMLGTQVPWETDGRSALDPAADRGPIKRIVRRTDDWFSLPEETLTIPQAVAHQRLRREAFIPTAECQPTRCAYLVGPGAPFVGRPIGTRTIGPPSDLAAALTLPRTFDGDAESSLPALILGNVEGDEDYDGQVAVVANGAIAGVSDTWMQDGEAGWFGVVIPEFLMRQDDNDIRIYEVRGSTFHRIEVTS